MSQTKAFTDKYLAALKPRATRYDVVDGSRRGLTLRVFPSGTKTFFLRYQRNEVIRRVTLGNYPMLPLRLAYEAHADLTRRLHRGEDISATPPAVTGGLDSGGARVPTGPTVGELAAEFIRRYVQRERKRPVEAEQTIEANILKTWRHRPAKSITRRDGVLLLDKIVDRGSPVMANRVAALLAQMFSFGVERGMLDASPFISLPRPGGTEKSRNRKLDDREVRVFWKKLTTSRLSAEVRIALKLILVTAQRPGEIALAARQEFDLENRIWTIPPERTKNGNGKPHVVPLSDLALTLLHHLRRRFGETQYLISSRCWRARHGAPITVRALSQGIRDREAHFEIPHFTPHDLRRTAASLMTAAGVPRLHVEKVLNHTIDDVAEIYDRYDYAEEKRMALKRLDDSLRRIARREPKVVAFNRSERMRAVG
jgi:integrase